MNPTLEKVARAICGSGVACSRARLKFEPCLNADGSNGACLANQTQLTFCGPLDAARKALTALLPPSEGMVEAMYRAALFMRVDYEEGAKAAAGKMFVAAIQQALKEGEG